VQSARKQGEMGRDDSLDEGTMHAKVRLSNKITDAIGTGVHGETEEDFEHGLLSVDQLVELKNRKRAAADLPPIDGEAQMWDCLESCQPEFCRRIMCCTSHFYGCHACAKNDKQFLLILLVLLVLVVLPEALLLIGELGAIGELQSTFQDAVSSASILIQVMYTCFSFLNIGVLALIGATRTQDQDPEAQALSDFKTGRIFQVGSLIALLGGLIAMGIVFGFYPTFIKDVMGYTDEERSAVQSYINQRAPMLPLRFWCLVAQQVCLQCGYIPVVLGDVFVDAVIGVGMFYMWADKVDDHPKLQHDYTTIDRIGGVFFWTQLIKTAIYAAFFIVKRAKFHLTTFDFPEGTLDKSKLGWDLCYQWVTSMVTATMLLLTTIFVSRPNDDTLVAYNVISATLGFCNMVPTVMAMFIIFIGSRWLADKQFAMFWGLKLCAMSISIVWSLTFGIGFFFYSRGSNRKNLTNDENEDHVKCLVDGGLVTFFAILNILAFALETVYNALFNAFNRFYWIMVVNLVAFFVFYLPPALLGTYANTNYAEGTVGTHCDGYEDGSWDIVVAANFPFFHWAKFLMFLYIYIKVIRPDVLEEQASIYKDFEEGGGAEKNFLDFSETLSFCGKGPEVSSTWNPMKLLSKRGQADENTALTSDSEGKYTEGSC